MARDKNDDRLEPGIASARLVQITHARHISAQTTLICRNTCGPIHSNVIEVVTTRREERQRCVLGILAPRHDQPQPAPRPTAWAVDQVARPISNQQQVR